jgi:dTDP-4-dehydrorhamnose reductase
MSTLLLGKNGQVGWELQRSLAPLGPLVALDRRGQNRLCGDLADLDGLRGTMRELKPGVVVNAAAYTAVDQAEKERELASLINARAPAVLAEEAKALGALLVHYSTDYVFDGSGTVPWREEDSLAPLNHYGASKLAGERAIQAQGGRHLIFRTSWVFAARGQNFLTTMMRLIQERDALDVVSDQVGAPTGAEWIADVTAHAVRSAESGPGLNGLFHLAASGKTNWYGYACLISQRLQEQGVPTQASPDRIRPIPTTEWPTPAQRPLNSRLDTSRLEHALNLQLPPWQAGVERALAERLHVKKQD